MDTMTRYTLTIDFVEPHIQQHEALETLDDIITGIAKRIRTSVEEDTIIQKQLAAHEIQLVMGLSH